MTETRATYTIYTDAEEISINGILADNHDLAAALLQAKAEIAGTKQGNPKGRLRIWVLTIPLKV